MKQAIILAGGKGTRLSARLGDLPKPMIPVGGRPLLEHQLDLCRRHGLTDVLLLVKHRAEVIRAHVGDGRRWGVHARYQLEEEPLGTAGAVLAAYAHLDEQFLVLYGDEMLEVDLGRFARAHTEVAADVSLLVHPNDHPLDSDLVEVDADGWVRAFHTRPHPPDRSFQNLVNAALYVVRRDALEPWRDPGRPMDFGKDLFPAMLAAGARLWAYRSPEYIKDIGTPERHDRVCAEFEAGVIAQSSLAVPQVAVFLDRDGTLNEERDGVLAPDQLRLLPGVAEAIRELNHRGVRTVVITNQPVVAKGFCTEADVEAVHRRLETLLGAEHAFLDRIYYCPHHPERGFPGERPELKRDCDCRKPRTGMITRAAQDLHLDLGRSWLVGDTTTDLETARRAGLRAILVRTGYAGRDARHAVTPDLACDNLAEAVRFIVTRSAPNPAPPRP